MTWVVWVLVIGATIAGCGQSRGRRNVGGASDSGASDASVGDSSAPVDGGATIDEDGASVADCPLADPCSTAPPPPGASTPWRHFLSTIAVASGPPRHRGRDLFLREGDPQWALAKFSYGPADDDIQDEDVTIQLLRGCGGSWEELGTVRTTNDGAHPSIEGVDDTGGRVYFEIPAERRLGVGRHRLHFVVRGDLSTADQIVEVVPAGARFVVTDVDGTQTESETAEWAAVLGGPDPAARPSGPELMTAYARRGYRILYLTARPDWLDARTHSWLELRGYPPGIVHTTLSLTGAMGTAAIDFKTAELAELEARFPGGLEDGIGNTDTDVAAYVNVGLPPERLFAYMYDPGPQGTRVDDYATLIPALEARRAICR